jgi:hypothetical protein
MLLKAVTVDVDDRLLHYLLVAGGMLLFSILKTGFDYLAKKFWRKADQEAEDIKAFKAWKKTQKPADAAKGES